MRSLFALAFGLLVAAGAAQAGSPCEDKPLKTADLEKSLDLALATRQALDQSGADVVLLARAGQDLGEYRLEWSHLGLAYKESSARAWLRGHGYQPSLLQIPAAKRLAAGVSRANIAFDDQPMGERMQGHIQTTTADSVFTWAASTGLASANVRITPGPSSRPTSLP